MNDVAIIGVGLHPFGRFGDKTAMEMGADADPSSRSTDAGVEWNDIQFAFGGSYEVSNPDAVTGLVGLTGIPFTDVFNACATAASAIQQTADAIRPGKYDIGIAIGMDKHPRGAFTDDPAKLGVPGLVRRERSVRHHQVLRHEDQPVHARPRHLAARRWPRWRRRTTATARSTRTPSAGRRSPRRRSSTRRCSTTR